MRCPSCNKFVSFDTEAEPEGEVEVAEDGAVTGEYRRVLTCADCSEELKETTFSIDTTVEIDDGAKPEEGKEECKDGEHQWESEGDETAEPTMRTQTKDRHGKDIKNPRYQRTYYGFTVNGSAKCVKCGVTGHYSYEDECAASGFDELT